MFKMQIVLTTDNSLLSRLARALGATWTHAMLRFPNEACKRLGCKEQHCLVIEATMRRGVIERAWTPGEYTKWAVYGLRPKYVARNTNQRVLDYARGNVGKWYAFDKLLLVIPRFLRTIVRHSVIKFELLRYFRRSENHFSIILMGERAHICSSLVDDCLFAAGIDLVSNYGVPWVLPDDFLDSDLLELVEEGGSSG